MFGNFFISPLRRAIRQRDDKQVQKVLEEAGEGAPDLINEDYTADCFCACCMRNYQDPLHTACGVYNLSDNRVHEIVRLLVDHGADVNSRGLWGQTPLHKACRQSCLPLTKYLCENGADIYVQSYVYADNFGFYPIHCAALSLMSSTFKNIDVLIYMLEEVGKPEDIQLKDLKGNSPLHSACMWENPMAVSYLISKGANLNAKNDDGQTPKDVAKPGVLALLEKSLGEETSEKH